ncbi:MAG: AMP-binding protein [Candidatus Gracilibacteria bacterium]
MNRIGNLSSAVEYAKQAPYYKRVLPTQAIDKLEDFHALPFLDNRSYRQNTPPNNNDLCAKDPAGCFVFSSGGTTSEPRLVLRDFDDIGDQHEYFQGLDIGPTDTVINLFMPGIWGVFSTTNIALSRLGCRIIPQGGTRLDEEAMAQIKFFIKQFGANCFTGMPSTILTVADYLKNDDEARAKVNKIYCLGEKVFQSTLDHLYNIFPNAVVKSAYGCMESAAIGYQCANKTLSDYHVFPYQHVEIVDPETGNIVPDEQFGEIIITTLKRRLIPLVRYRTGDIGALTTDECRCGGETQMLNVKGRSQDMIVSASLHVAVDQIRNILSKFPECSDAFQIIVGNYNHRDAIKIMIESESPSTNLASRIKEKCISEIQDLESELQTGRIHSFEIVCVAKNSIERVRTTGKIKRIIDLRK